MLVLHTSHAPLYPASSYIKMSVEGGLIGSIDQGTASTRLLVSGNGFMNLVLPPP